MTLTEFLLARIAEDEEVAQSASGSSSFAVSTGRWVFEKVWDPARVLAECAAKRRVIDEIDSLEAQIHSEWGVGPMDENSIPGLQALAQPYADHPDFRPEWATRSQGR